MPLGGYGLPVFASVMAIAYNKDHVKNPPQALADFANPEFKGRVGIFTLESVGGIVDLIALAEANGGSLQNLDPGFAKLKEIKPNLATTASAPVELFNLLQRGEIWLTSFWSGRVNALIDQGAPLGIAIPKEGLRNNLDYISLVKGTKHREAALKYMNEVVSQRTSLALAREMYFGPTNKTVQLPAGLEHRVLPYGEDMIAHMRPIDWDVVADNRGKWVERWNREMR